MIGGNVLKTKRISGILSSKTAMVAYILIAVTVFFGIWNDGFLSTTNISALLVSMSLTGTIAVGVTMILICGEIDLAAGAEACMGGIFVVLLIQAGIPWPIALILTLIGGGLMGAILAFFVNKVGLMAFIVSMSMISVYNGFAKILTSSQEIPIDQCYSDYYFIGSGTVFGFIPVAFLIMAALMIIYGIILYSTEFGRSVYMCGGNRAAARLCGINRKKITTILFINNGAICALAGAVLAARMHSASPSACLTGNTDAITAAVLGGVAFRGGQGSMWGCFLGLALMTVFNSGLTASGLGAYWQIVVQGLLLIVALLIDYLNERSRKKSLGEL